MSKAPAFQLYARDFLGDHLVDAMEPEELGGYFRLLLIAWQQEDRGYLPNDERMLAAWSKLGRRWKKNGPAILACFRTADDGRLFQKRMVEVAAEQADYREQQRQKGLAAAAARAAVAAARAAEEANRGSTAAQPRLLSGSSSVPTEGQPEPQPEGNPSSPSPSPSPPKTVEEEKESTRACVRDRLRAGFATVGVQMPDAQTFGDCVRLASEYAEATGQEPEGVADRAFVAAKKLASTWSVKGITPYLFAKHWDKVQLVMAGTDPTPVDDRRSRAGPQRRGALPPMEPVTESKTETLPP